MKKAGDTAQPTQKMRSLQATLAWHLGAVLVVSMSLVIASLFSYLWIALDDLDDASLQVQAQQISHNIDRDGERLSLSLPEALTRIYNDLGDGFLYAIKDDTGRIVIASSQKARQLLEPIETIQAVPFFFRMAGSRSVERPYYSLAVALPDLPGHILFVAQEQTHRDVYFDTMIDEFGEYLVWILPVILFLALAMAIWTIRSSLAPLTAIVARASHIGPRNIDIRLPARNIPNEIRPLVEAVNGALNRLEQGFLLQRQFTANAAHELRTPLAILNARLDELDNSETAAMLAVDIQRMNRLVEQLLNVSRLDTEDLSIDDDVDLEAVAAETVSYLAPLAIAVGLTLSLSPAGRPVVVRGNAGALGDALRNLIENAIQHSPKGGEIQVAITAEGTLTVEDQGAGIDDDDLQHIFQRFWRGRNRSETGSGLGLAIVRETADAHGGGISVRNKAEGGAIFSLNLPVVVRRA